MHLAPAFGCFFARRLTTNGGMLPMRGTLARHLQNESNMSMTRPHESYRPAAPKSKQAKVQGLAQSRLTTMNATEQTRSVAKAPANDVLSIATPAARAVASDAASEARAQVRSQQAHGTVQTRTPSAPKVEQQAAVTVQPKVATFATQPTPRTDSGVFGTLVSMIQFYAKADDTNAQKRAKSPLTVVKETLLMAFGKDEGDEYECSNG